MRLTVLALRPDAQGMTDQPCPKVQNESLHRAATQFRRIAGDQPAYDDWTGICAYYAENAAIRQSGKPVDVVFIGDSITQHWAHFDPALFDGARLNRGITSQSAAQILARFPSDVVALKPRVVHIIAGTNDVVGTSGPSSPQAWRDAMTAMVDLARANGIAVIVGTLPPMAVNPFDDDHRPVPIIAEQNRWLAQLAQEKGLVLADYHAALSMPQGGFKPGLAYDALHPDGRGYAAMRPVLDAALARVKAAPAK
ncbi:MAG: GDSL-type esterase/lipase family protein [Novosphingobium sp.]